MAKVFDAYFVHVPTKQTFLLLLLMLLFAVPKTTAIAISVEAKKYNKIKSKHGCTGGM